MKASRDLGELFNLFEEEDAALKIKLASIMYDIMNDIITPILEEFPKIADSIENRIDKYGRAF